jgi:hypothetical protein
MTSRINCVYKNGSMEEGLQGYRSKVPRSAGSRIDILSQPGRIDERGAKVQFTMDPMNSFNPGYNLDKRNAEIIKPLVAFEHTIPLLEKPGTSGNTPKGQHLKIAPFYINTRAKFSNDFLSSKLLFHLSI